MAIWGKNYKSIQKTGLVYPSTGSQTPPACRGYESLGQKILEIQFFKVYHVSPHFKGILISNFNIEKSLENLERNNRHYNTQEVGHIFSIIMDISRLYNKNRRSSTTLDVTEKLIKVFVDMISLYIWYRASNSTSHMICNILDFAQHLTQTLVWTNSSLGKTHQVLSFDASWKCHTIKELSSVLSTTPRCHVFWLVLSSINQAAASWYPGENSAVSLCDEC